MEIRLVAATAAGAIMAVVGLVAIAAGVILAGVGLVALVAAAVRRARASPVDSVTGGGVAPYAPAPIANALQASGPAPSGRAAALPTLAPSRGDWLSDLRFDPPTLAPTAQPPHRPVRLAVTLGPRSARPLILPLPLLLSGVGQGAGASDAVSQAIAEAATLSAIAANSREGQIEAAALATGGPWVWRSRRACRRQPAQVPSMSMIEVLTEPAGGRRAGWGGTPASPPRLLRRRSGKGRRLRVAAAPPDPLAARVRRAKALCGGRPVAVRIPASQHVEADVAHLVAMGVDVITLEGA